MMKKLMVLSLVLAVGAVASAAWSIDVAADSASATVYGDYTADELFVVVFQQPTTVIGFDAANAAMLDATESWGTLADNEIPSPDGFIGELWFVGAFGTVANQFGIKMWEITGIVMPETIAVYRADADTGWIVGDALASAVIGNVIPEPMTMGLLGLGALFLRRRK